MADMILRLRRVLEVTGLGRTTLYTEVAAGRFPAAVALTARCVGWRLSDIEAWMAARQPTGPGDAA